MCPPVPQLSLTHPFLYVHHTLLCFKILHLTIALVHAFHHHIHNSNTHLIHLRNHCCIGNVLTSCHLILTQIDAFWYLAKFSFVTCYSCILY